MSGFFAARSSGDSWFRVGRVEFGTVTLVTSVVVVSWLTYVLSPAFADLLALYPGLLAEGQLWRLVTWPLDNPPGLWGALTLFFFWYFGSELELGIGRLRMAWLLVGVWGSLTIASMVTGLLLADGYGIGGIGVIQFAILLLWIAEFPDRRFIFNIPAWLFGLVLVGLQVLQAIAARDLGGLLSLALGLALIAIAARRSGLLSAYRWIPGGPGRRRPATVRRRPSQPTARQSSRATSDRERLDELLDQINDRGIGSLTDAQRKEMMKLRERMKRG